jgi:hypothetical protein
MKDFFIADAAKFDGAVGDDVLRGVVAVGAREEDGRRGSISR